MTEHRAGYGAGGSAGYTVTAAGAALSAMGLAWCVVDGRGDVRAAFCEREEAGVCARALNEKAADGATPTGGDVGGGMLSTLRV